MTGDMGEMWNAAKEDKRERKAKFGVECPDCTVNLPKAQPKVLLPGQRCWCGYRDPRPRGGGLRDDLYVL